jgi:hypothetical protein
MERGYTMTPELTVLLVEKLLRYGPEVISGLVITLGRTPTLDEVRALGITKRPEEYFQHPPPTETGEEDPA